MPPEQSEPAAKTDHSDVRVVAFKALLQLLEPLVGFALNAGLSIQELHAVLRQAAVRSLAAEQLEVVHRVNISGIAASTGIPRAEISRILRAPRVSQDKMADRQQQSTNRVLAVWHQDPKFGAPTGVPAELKIYGRGATFETLVKIHGRGIPTRAMLDELTRMGATELRPCGMVRVKSSVAVDRGLTPRAIRSFGDRATQLLSTMLQNIRHPENPRFIASISGAKVLQAELPLFRKELSTKGADFLADLHDSLTRIPDVEHQKLTDSLSSRVSITIFYHETERKPKRKKILTKRTNFRREA